MTKRSISIVWIIGSAVMFLGGFGTIFVSVSTDPGNWLNGNTNATVMLLVFAISVAAAGVIGQLVAWLGAVFNSHELADRTWFNLLLWLGIAGIVLSPAVIGGIVWWVLMLAYVVGAPEGRPVTAPARLSPDRLTTPASR